MAPLPGDIFLRLPPSAAALLLSAIFGLTNGHDLPRETKAVGRHDPDAVPFPPAPTVAPWFAFNFSRREDNTICGYIGGNPSLPATCSPGSHCALDAANLVVGCCPNGYPCTTGFFTSCVDWRNGPQTEINPYIFTCQGTNVCYKNNFASGYFQYGCGTTADLGTTVEMSAHGASAALSIKTTTMRLTAAPITLSTPVAIGSSPPTSRASPTKSSSTGKNSTDGGPSKSGPGPTSTVSPSHTPTATPILPPSSTSSTAGNPPKTTRSSSQSSSTISTTKSRSSSTKSHKTSTTWKTVTHSTPSTSKTASPSATSTDDDPPSSQTASTSPPSSTPTDGAGSIKKSQTGAIVGGVVGGAAGLISLVALVFFCLRRGQNRNGRTGPGPAPEEPPMTQYSGPIRSHDASFTPLPSWNEDEHPDNYPGDSDLQPPDSYGPLEPSSSGQAPRSSFSGPGRGLAPPAPANLNPNAHGGYSQPLRYNPVYSMTGGLGAPPSGGLPPVAEEDQQSSERSETPPQAGQQQPQQQLQSQPPQQTQPPHQPQHQQQQQQHQAPVLDPQRSEIEDFSRAYSNAGIGRLADEDDDVEGGNYAEGGDQTPLRGNAHQQQHRHRVNHGGGPSSNYSSHSQHDEDDDDSYPRRRNSSHRPLWQQNRQQSRNLMWL